jgi:hypothetical protein
MLVQAAIMTPGFADRQSELRARRMADEKNATSAPGLPIRHEPDIGSEEDHAPNR